ncbi:FtsX-like permease family protein [Urbifossiella limnaea]|uniref:FtsX-like permease family protein n=1 Tax=Urbifossiella limnaea TaxID=2528023 RepID=A0A517XV54_9BACT|nr:FtsX-like permease family protein [Urbifossiella limnaea]
MLKFLPYVRKNVLGHRVRTAMTVAGTALLLFLFLFVTAIQGGLDRVLGARDDRLIVFQAYRFCPSSSQLPVFYADTIQGVPGVKSVLPVKVVVNNCRASLDTVVFHGVDPKLLPAVRPNLTLLAGDWGAFQARTDAAIVGRRIAERRGLRPGQSFTVAGVTVQVAGVFASDGTGEENVIYTHLNLLSNPTAHHVYHATLFEVQLDDPEHARAVAAAIDAKLKEKFEVPTETKPQKAHYAAALADLLDLIGMTRWLGFVCVGVVVVLVANSVVMSAQDRVKEHAVLQTLGFSGPRVFSLMLAESCLISLAGGVVGTVACVAFLLWRPMTLSTEGASIDFVASPGLVASGLLLSLAVGFVAGAVPAWQAGRAEIVSSLR